MTAPAQPASTATSVILKAWLIAGTLDICGAMTWSYIARIVKGISNPNPLDVLFSVGRAALGKEFSTPGMLGNYTLMCIIGVIVHYAIAFAWTMIFFWAWQKIKLLQGDKIVVGLCYGVFVWAAMTLAIVPLRVMSWGPFTTKGLLIGCGIIMLAIGLPISIIIGNYYRRAKKV